MSTRCIRTTKRLRIDIAAVLAVAGSLSSSTWVVAQAADPKPLQTTVDPKDRLSPSTSPKGSAPLAVTRHVIASGGGSSRGGSFDVQGTIGQAEAEPLHPASGGVLAVTGGYWAGLAGTAPDDVLFFRDGFESL